MTAALGKRITYFTQHSLFISQKNSLWSWKQASKKRVAKSKASLLTRCICQKKLDQTMHYLGQKNVCLKSTRKKSNKNAPSVHRQKIWYSSAKLHWIDKLNPIKMPQLSSRSFEETQLLFVTRLVILPKWDLKLRCKTKMEEAQENPKTFRRRPDAKSCRTATTTPWNTPERRRRAAGKKSARARAPTLLRET